MDEQRRHWDPQAHEAGCLHNGANLPLSDPGNVYIDVFCDCHHFTEPKILSNGSDIAWPAGWDQAQARVWRRQNGLTSPPGLEVA